MKPTAHMVQALLDGLQREGDADIRAGLAYLDDDAAQRIVSAILHAASCWQPIETAPVNERIVLWRKGRSPWTSRYYGPRHDYGYGAKPTHWVPIPEPPEDE